MMTAAAARRQAAHRSGNGNAGRRRGRTNQIT